MSSDEEKPETPQMPDIKEGDLLSFRSTGRPIPLDSVEDEFALMQECLKSPLTAEIAARICEKSGSHLLKLVSPRVDGDHAVLRLDATGSNRRSRILPSTNAPDIPFCKVVYRPMEIIGRPSCSVVDLILNPEDHSVPVLRAFAQVFGADVLEAMRKSLLAVPKPPLKLGAGEFPIIFIPRPGGGDLQITPVSPAATFEIMRVLGRRRYEKRDPEGPKINRGKWHDQAISSKPQNISGAIGGPRVRFLASMPAGMDQGEAELYRHIKGGSFPRWRDEAVSKWILRYADMLEADTSFNNADTRAALNQTADRLIQDAMEFITEAIGDAKHLADHHGLPHDKLSNPPGPSVILLRRKWVSDNDHGRARNALTSPHFENRLIKGHNGRESGA